MGSGKLDRRTPWQSVQRWAGDCGARVASPCGDDRRHGVAAESLEVFRQQSTSKPEVPMFRPDSGSCKVRSVEIRSDLASPLRNALMKRGWRAGEVADFTTKGYDVSPHWFAPHPVRD